MGAGANLAIFANFLIFPLLLNFTGLKNFPIFFAGLQTLSILDIQLLRERLSEKMCTRQSRKVIWNMTSILLFLSNIFLMLFFSTRKHTSMTFRAILSNFSFEEE